MGTATEDASTFVAVEPGAALDLLPGSQGGFHVFVRARLGAAHVAALGPEWILTREARRADTGAVVSRATQRVTERGNGLRMVPTEEPGLLETDKTMLLFLCPTPEGVPIVDRMLELEMTASSDGGPTGLQGYLRFRPRCPSGEPRVFCREICSG